MKVIIGADHAGFTYKGILIKAMEENGYDVFDAGTYNSDPDDYPDRAAEVAQALTEKQADRGILICGSAVGVSIAANKFRGIRAGVCHDTYSAHQCVEHDDTNILCIGERVIGIELAKDIVFTYLKASYNSTHSHQARLDKISAIEDKNMIKASL